MRYLLMIGILATLIGCGSGKDNDNQGILIPLPNNAIAESDSFNLAFHQLLAGYYQLTNDFNAESASVIDASAIELRLLVDSFPFATFKADSNLVLTARSYTEGISAELQGLLGENGLDKKRMALQMISDQLYELIRTVQYRGAVIYHFYCSEAIDDQGAYWLSEVASSKNPYLSPNNSSCAELKDSIDFRRMK